MGQTSNSLNKANFPSGLNLAKNLHLLALVVDLLVIGLAAVYDFNFDFIFSKIALYFSIFASIVFKIQFIRLVPFSENETLGKIRRTFFFDFLQILVISFFLIDSLENVNGASQIVRAIASIPWVIIWLIYFFFFSSVKSFYSNNIEVSAIPLETDIKESNFLIQIYGSIFELIGIGRESSKKNDSSKLSKMPLPFGLKITQTLFRLVVGFGFFLLAISIALMNHFTLAQFVSDFSIILSVFFYLKILHQLQKPYIENRKKILQLLFIDLSQQLLITCSFIVIDYLKSGFIESGTISVNVFKILVSSPWLVIWILYFYFSKKIKEYFSFASEDSTSEPYMWSKKQSFWEKIRIALINYDWIFLIRNIFLISVYVWFIIELREFVLEDKRGKLDMFFNLVFLGVHIYIIWILKKNQKETPSQIVFLLSIVLSFYFVHHFAGYLFFSDEIGEINYRIVMSLLTLFWCGLWIFVFSKSKIIVTKFQGVE